MVDVPASSCLFSGGGGKGLRSWIFCWGNMEGIFPKGVMRSYFKGHKYKKTDRSYLHGWLILHDQSIGN